MPTQTEIIALARIAASRRQIQSLYDSTGGDLELNVRVKSTLFELDGLARYIQSPAKGAPDNA